jgi:hypothetical protein
MDGCAVEAAVILALVILHFALCPADGHACEDGFTIAASCERAEQWLRDGLRPGQVLHVFGCRAYQRGDWQGVD